MFDLLFFQTLKCLSVCLSPYRSVCLSQLQVGVEFEASTRMQDSSVSLGYQLDVPKANLQFKGTASKRLLLPSL